MAGPISKLIIVTIGCLALPVYGRMPADALLSGGSDTIDSPNTSQLEEAKLRFSLGRKNEQAASAFDMPNNYLPDNSQSGSSEFTKPLTMVRTPAVSMDTTTFGSRQHPYYYSPPMGRVKQQRFTHNSHRPTTTTATDMNQQIHMRLAHVLHRLRMLAGKNPRRSSPYRRRQRLNRPRFGSHRSRPNRNRSRRRLTRPWFGRPLPMNHRHNASQVTPSPVEDDPMRIMENSMMTPSVQPAHSPPTMESLINAEPSNYNYPVPKNFLPVTEDNLPEASQIPQTALLPMMEEPVALPILSEIPVEAPAVVVPSPSPPIESPLPLPPVAAASPVPAQAPPAAPALPQSPTPPTEIPPPVVAAPTTTTTATTTNFQFRGDGTFYYPAVGLGSCGQLHQDSELVVALNKHQYGEMPNPNMAEVCGKQVEIKGPKGTVRATVTDTCPGDECLHGSLDLSPATFDKIADRNAGRVPIEWSFV
ncbi:hypothetical protein BJ085DRAFT_37375 [Dimargaris cristalligena]|uniref:RlpA-like double-psi beta-barrel-protein domain-containing protein-containing protein n=1 Tax=Dimargaris cristalligena TaxID=215637 RepID=A0A4P9ZPN0_9FUNG|nr:hypothetical protein BJ085DRAFT_37375 [Dimargaris cristalligena]|eukprot:RKP35396.1 hypothetical protein BJ085DRAFT_37375 [Dimargaris cristalligena]